MNAKNRLPAHLKLVVVAISALAASGPVAAQGSSGTIEEIIVTAQKRAQNLQEVPLAVSAFSGDRLRDSGITSSADLVRLVPTLSFNDAAFPINASYRLRGAGTQSSSSSVEPSVSVVMDGVVVARPAQGVADLADIERIEVLRGPQGTLFGKNASAGVIHIITKRPSQDFEGLAEVSFAEDGQYGAKGTVSGPLSDTVGFRLSGHYRNDDGFVENLATGNTINGTENWSLRGKLEFQPTDQLNVLLAADYGETKATCCALMPILNVNGPDPAGFLALIAPTVPDDESRQINQSWDPRQEQQGSGIAAEIEYDLARGMTFTSITSYREWEYSGAQADIDFQPLTEGTAVPGIAFTFTDQTGQFGLGAEHENEVFSQEFRLASSGDDAINWVAGLFYWQSDYHERATSRDFTCFFPGGFTGPAMTACANGATRSRIMTIDTENENLAAFGQVNWHATDNLEMFVGLRLIKEDLSWAGNRPNSPAPEFPTDVVNPGGAPGPLPYNESFKTDDSGWSGTFGGKLDLTDHARIYASYSRGYKGPASNTNGFTFSAVPVAPEIVDSYEAGFRSELLANSLNLNITAFYSDYSDFQSQTIDQSTTPASFFLTNVGEFRTQGVEIEMIATPLDNLDISGSIAYTDAVFNSFPDAQCYVGQTVALGCVGGLQDLSGKESPNSPDWKFNLTARYELPVGTLQAFVQGDYVWQDDIFYREDQNPMSFQESFSLFDLSIGARADDDRYEVTFFVKNLFDENWASNRFQIGLPTGNASGVITLARNASRYAGARVRINF